MQGGLLLTHLFHETRPKQIQLLGDLLNKHKKCLQDAQASMLLAFFDVGRLLAIFCVFASSQYPCLGVSPLPPAPLQDSSSPLVQRGARLAGCENVADNMPAGIIQRTPFAQPTLHQAESPFDALK